MSNCELDLCCFYKEFKETAMHFICDCKATRWKRLYKAFLKPAEVRHLVPKNILKVIKGISQQIEKYSNFGLAQVHFVRMCRCSSSTRSSCCLGKETSDSTSLSSCASATPCSLKTFSP
uniref:Uncharacterized protein n=1 Tax=Homalodisca liturata TaxID=320908 RepID=A0A1B6HUJ7_9HEMI